MAHIVVIGAGMGGLAAASRLATVGHRVTLCEAGPTHGGMVGQYEREGFRFDTGPTLLTLPAVYRDLMLKTGRTRLEDEVELRPVDPGSVHVLPDGTRLALANASRAKVLEAVGGALGVDAAERWSGLLERGRVVWEATRRPLLEEPLPEDPAVLREDPYPALQRGLLGRGLLGRGRGPARTLGQVAARELRHPALTALLDEYALRFGLDPDEAPASLTVMPYMEQSFGVWYVTGGMRALADAVLRRCEQRRVELRFGAAVTAVLDDGGAAAGVRLSDGTEIAADAVVAGTDLATVRRLRPDAATAAQAARAAAAPGRFTVLLALRGARPAGVPHRTVVHAPDREDELDAVFARRGPARPCARPTVQVLRPDDASLVPEGCETVVLTVTVPAQGAGTGLVDWTANGVADAYADAVLAHVGSTVPELGASLAERLLWREVRTPADTERETGAPGGSVPVPALAGAGGQYLAVANTAPVKGLYLVGGSAHPGGGLARVGMSASVTAGIIGTP